MSNENFNKEVEVDEDQKSTLWISISAVLFMFSLLFVNTLISYFDDIKFKDIESEIKNIKVNNELFLSNYKDNENFLEENTKHIIKFKDDEHVEIFCKNLIMNLEAEDGTVYSDKKLARIKGQVHHFENQIYDDTNISEDSKKAIHLIHEFALEIYEYANIIGDVNNETVITATEISNTYKKGKLGEIIATDKVEKYIKK